MRMEEFDLYAGLGGGVYEIVSSQGRPCRSKTDVCLAAGARSHLAEAGAKEGPAASPLTATSAVLAFQDAELKELRRRVESLMLELAAVTQCLKDRDAQIEAYHQERMTLVRNLSCIYRTAVLELDRKASEIKDLRSQLQQHKQLGHSAMQHKQQQSQRQQAGLSATQCDSRPAMMAALPKPHPSPPHRPVCESISITCSTPACLAAQHDKPTSLPAISATTATDHKRSSSPASSQWPAGVPQQQRGRPAETSSQWHSKGSNSHDSHPAQYNKAGLPAPGSRRPDRGPSPHRRPDLGSRSPGRWSEARASPERRKQDTRQLSPSRHLNGSHQYSGRTAEAPRYSTDRHGDALCHDSTRGNEAHAAAGTAGAQHGRGQPNGVKRSTGHTAIAAYTPPGRADKGRGGSAFEPSRKRSRCDESARTESTQTGARWRRATGGSDEDS
ncbi:hypothetical protein V8C86DRAFT_2464297 [Haematococcus lacustris]